MPVGSAVWEPSSVRRETYRSNWPALRERTTRPFAVNHVVPALDEDAFAYTLAARPPVIAFALGDAGDLVQRAHEVGSLVIQQVTYRAASPPGRRAGRRHHHRPGRRSRRLRGHDCDVHPPAASRGRRPSPAGRGGGGDYGRAGPGGGLGPGRRRGQCRHPVPGLRGSPIPLGWKHRIVEAEAQDAVKVEVWNDISPVPGSRGYGTAIRALRTPFIDTWQHRRDEARREADRLRGEVLAALQQGRIHELLPFAGESAGLVHDIVPAGEIVQRLVAEARHALERSQTLLT